MHCQEVTLQEVTLPDDGVLLPLSHSRMAIVQMEKMDKCFEVAARNFSTVRTGRANPGMLDRVQVNPDHDHDLILMNVQTREEHFSYRRS